MKSAREHMDINAAYREVGTYQRAADICGTPPPDHHAGRARAQATTGGGDVVAHDYDQVPDIVVQRVHQRRTSAKRPLPVVRGGGIHGSVPNVWRLVAEAKAGWRADHHRGR